jgi:hypothetical protein
MSPAPPELAPVVIVPPVTDPDDEAWERLFAELTGGTEEVRTFYQKSDISIVYSVIVLSVF